MDTITTILFLLNNIIWMFFFYLFTPRQQTRNINLPIPFVKKQKKESEFNPKKMQDIESLDMTPSQVIQQMKGKPKDGN